jgi:hypothetical protein
MGNIRVNDATFLASIALVLRVNLLIKRCERLNARLQDHHAVIDQLFLRQISTEESTQQLGRRRIESVAQQTGVALLESGGKLSARCR